MSKEVIVYLDEYKYSGDGNYDIMYLDFVQHQIMRDI